jgi:hypothetical protein
MSDFDLKSRLLSDEKILAQTTTAASATSGRARRNSLSVAMLDKLRQRNAEMPVLRHTVSIGLRPETGPDPRASVEMLLGLSAQHKRKQRRARRKEKQALELKKDARELRLVQRRWLLFAVSMVYVGAGVLFYSLVMRWSVVESLYFSVVTWFTVGYGDLHPDSAVGRIFTVFYSFVGIVLIGSTASMLGEKLLLQQEHFILKVKEKVELEQSAFADDPSDSDSEDEDSDWCLDCRKSTNSCFQTTAKKLHFLFAQLYTWRVIVLVVYLLGGSLIWAYAEDWSFDQALYFSAMTVTTIGYGDYHPTSDLARLWSIAFITSGVIAIGVIVSSVSESFLKGFQAKSKKRIRAKMTSKQFDVVDSDGDGFVRWHEYLAFALIEDGVVDAEAINAIHAKFLELDADLDGAIEKQDLV